MKGLIVIGHGSRAEGTKAVFEKTVEGLKVKMQDTMVSGCFMELSKPQIPETIDEMYAAGVRDITILPYFLFPGIHILEDIPEILKAKKEQLEGLSVKMAQPIGYDERLVEILADRAEGEAQCI